jgi:hypothetical protein
MDRAAQARSFFVRHGQIEVVSSIIAIESTHRAGLPETQLLKDFSGLIHERRLVDARRPGTCKEVGRG